jgi:iron complex outermembrane recepter protein
VRSSEERPVPAETITGEGNRNPPFLRGVTLTGRVVQTGKQEVNVANTLELPSWTRFDLGGRYVFLAADKPVTLGMSVDNVANKRYWASAYGGYLVQGGPRTFKVSASIDL